MSSGRVFLLIVVGLIIWYRSKDIPERRVSLPATKRLAFYVGRNTSVVRSQSQPQLERLPSVGQKPEANPPAVFCYNKGNDPLVLIGSHWPENHTEIFTRNGGLVAWYCMAPDLERDGIFELQTMSIACEGFDRDDDIYVRDWSCSLKYDVSTSRPYQGALEKRAQFKKTEGELKFSLWLNEQFITITLAIIVVKIIHFFFPPTYLRGLIAQYQKETRKTVIFEWIAVDLLQKSLRLLPILEKWIRRLIKRISGEEAALPSAETEKQEQQIPSEVLEDPISDQLGDVKEIVESDVKEESITQTTADSEDALPEEIPVTYDIEKNDDVPMQDTTSHNSVIVFSEKKQSEEETDNGSASMSVDDDSDEKEDQSPATSYNSSDEFEVIDGNDNEDDEKSQALMDNLPSMNFVTIEHHDFQ